MAESDVRSEQIHNEEEQEGMSQEQRLKYLDFVHVAAIHSLICLSKLYNFAKENSGPLLPGVQTAEESIKAVVGPVYDKFHNLPFDTLKFVDRKVGESIEEIERHLPSSVKDAAQKAPEVARSISGEVQRAGVVGTATGLARSAYSKAEPTAKVLYSKYEPVAEHYAVSAWRSLNRLPLFPHMAQIVVPTAAYWSDKYNKVVVNSAEKGYAVSGYLPLVPVEKIAKVFGEEEKGVEMASVE